MDLIFLGHANDRMEQRGISEAEVVEVWGAGEVSTPEELNGMIRIDGSTSGGRPLSIVRLKTFPVVVSVVEP